MAKTAIFIEDELLLESGGLLKGMTIRQVAKINLESVSESQPLANSSR
jgi:hypothetical protein